VRYFYFQIPLSLFWREVQVILTTLLTFKIHLPSIPTALPSTGAAIETRLSLLFFLSQPPPSGFLLFPPPRVFFSLYSFVFVFESFPPFFERFCCARFFFRSPPFHFLFSLFHSSSVMAVTASRSFLLHLTPPLLCFPPVTFLFSPPRNSRDPPHFFPFFPRPVSYS